MLQLADYVKIISSIPIPSFIFQDMQIKFANGKFTEVTGYTVQELEKIDPGELIHQDDRLYVKKNIINCYSGIEINQSIEFRALTKNAGPVYVLGHFARIELNGNPAILVQCVNISMRKQTEDLLRVQRNLSQDLISCSCLPDAFNLILEAAFKVDGVDCGGIYLVDPLTGNLDLAAHKGIADDFVRIVSFYEYNTPQALLVMEGIPLYANHSDGVFFSRRVKKEGLQAFAAVPVLHDGKVIADLNIASHKIKEFSLPSRNMIEGIAAQIGSVITRFKAETDLSKSRESLARELEVSDALADLSAKLLLTESFEEISQLVLDEAKRLTGSRYGFVGYLDEVTGHVVFITLSREMWDTCQVRDKTFVFENFTGLWGWVLNNKKAILTNSPADDPRYRGTPQGHIPIERFLAVPAMIGEKLVGEVALANSGCDYTDTDLEIAEKLSNIYALAIQRKWLDEELRRSEKESRTLFETMSHGVMCQDARGEIIAANTAAQRILGVSPEQIFGSSLSDPEWKAIREDGSDLPSQEYPSTIALETGREVNNMVLGIYNPRERVYRWIIANAVPQFKDGENKPSLVFTTFEDITELKTAEGKIRTSRQQLLDIIDSLPDATFVIDSDKKVIAWNQALEVMTGVNKEDMIGKGDYAYAVPFYGVNRPILIDLVLSDDRKTELEYDFIMREGSALYAETYVQSVYGGKGAHLRAKISRLCDKDGNTIGAIESIHDITARKQAEEALAAERHRFASLTEGSPFGMVLFDDQGCYKYINPKFTEIFGFNLADIPDRKAWFDKAYPDPEYRNRVLAFWENDVRNSMPGEKKTRLSRVTCKDGEEKIISFTPVRLHTGEFLIACEDITRRRLAERELKAANRQLMDIIDFLPDATFVIDNDGRVIAWNKAIEEMTGVRKEEMLGKGDYAYAVPFYGETRPILIDLVLMPQKEIEEKYAYVIRSGNTLITETDVPFTYMGKGAILWGIATLLLDSDGNVIGAIESIRDVTEKKKAEEQLKYLSLHDPLTGLYNRTFFEEGMRRASDGRFDPLGIIICDLDGLKLINDTLGHDAGDSLLVEVAKNIGKSFRKGDIVSRIGGDEFAILLTRSDEKAVEEACVRLRLSFDNYNGSDPEIPLNVSIGFAVGSMDTTSVSELFKEADNNMYREKLHRSQSARSAIVQTLMKALEARDFITEGHANRLQDYVKELAGVLGMSTRSISDLSLLAKFHDIGKVGVPDRILFKPGVLTAEEALEMQRHSEIGHRIARSAPALEPIADWILKHHEWWNGSGYPLGLKGEEIPLECRILAIVDAFDAMTSDRPYRKALPREYALKELKRCSGTQFDPCLVNKFIDILKLEKAI
ncbi:PAS domain S-box protein [Pelotomaculum propionicicum]|uniref:PAS domain S-box protein n=1 Tax=Pelotomaculum propionicicum TaxID=258475 RepID=UPI003B78980D